MPFVRSASGLMLPMAARGGAPLLNSPGNVAAPPIVKPPSDLTFDMATGAKRGWPGSNNQFEFFGAGRDWAYNFKDPNESFAGIRWQPTWFQAYGFFGTWEMAGGDVFRMYRKGDSGQAARTIVMECGPNPAAVPVGDPVVVWQQWGDGDWNYGTLDLNGYRMPLRQKMTCTASYGSAWSDGAGRRIIELDAGTELPWFDYYPGTFASGGWYTKSQVQHRHWSFYKARNSTELRHPISWFTDLSLNSVLANDGYLMLGGIQAQPTWFCWSNEYNRMGASLTEELWRLECEGLAHYFGNTDPRRCAVELENEPVVGWEDSGGTPGYRTLLNEVWYPIAREEWGPERTIVVKPGAWGGLNQMIDWFDFRPPAGDNAHLVHHNYDDQIYGPSGAVNWTNIGQTDWMADQVRRKINELGYKGGGATELGVDWGRANGEWDRGQRLGRLLTSYTNRDLYIFFWSFVGDNVACSYVRDVNGRQIEAYYEEVAPYARRAGIMTT